MLQLIKTQIPEWDYTFESNRFWNMSIAAISLSFLRKRIISRKKNLIKGGSIQYLLAESINIVWMPKKLIYFRWKAENN